MKAKKTKSETVKVEVTRGDVSEVYEVLDFEDLIKQLKEKNPIIKTRFKFKIKDYQIPKYIDSLKMKLILSNSVHQNYFKKLIGERLK